MRPHSFYPRMPQGQHFNRFPGQMPPFNQFHPRQMPPGMMPQGFQMPNTGTPTPKPGSGSFMETASRFLSTAQNFQPLIQQATPLIQQATPMIRNLPALWKLYKGFQSAPNEQNKANNEFDFDLEDSSFVERPRRYDDSTYDERSRRFEESLYDERPKRYENSQYDERPRREDYYEQPRRDRSRSSYRDRDERRPTNREPQPSLPRIFQPPYNFD